MANYEDRYTDDTHGMAELLTVLPPPLPERFKVERLSDGQVEVEHPFPEVDNAIDRENEATSAAEYERYQIKQETELGQFLQDMEDGRDEMVRFTASAALVLTELTVSAARNPGLASELTRACSIVGPGFLSLANTLHANPSEFFENLAAFRRHRLAKEAAAQATAGT